MPRRYHHLLANVAQSFNGIPADMGLIQQELSRLQNQPNNQQLLVAFQQFQQNFNNRLNDLQAEVRAR
jgi:hypothetical protein